MQEAVEILNVAVSSGVLELVLVGVGLPAAAAGVAALKKAGVIGKKKTDERDHA